MTFLKHGFQFLILQTVNFRSLLNGVIYLKFMVRYVLWTVYKLLTCVNVFSCFIAFPYGVLSQVCYLIVLHSFLIFAFFIFLKCFPWSYCLNHISCYKVQLVEYLCQMHIFLVKPPQTLFVVGILFFTLSVRLCVRPSVTFCFLIILKSHCWIFINPCKHVHICKTNTLDKK